MKPNFYLLLPWLLLALGARAQTDWTDRARILPDQLRGVTTGIVISHNPTPVYPELNKDTVQYPGKYIWIHSTTVASATQNLTVVAAGSYVWWGEKKGWKANIKLTPKEFAARFKCPNALLRKSNAYTFLKNWRHEDSLDAGDAMWFVLAKNAAGKLYKGIAIVETEGTLKSN